MRRRETERMVGERERERGVNNSSRRGQKVVTLCISLRSYLKTRASLLMPR